MHIDDEVVGGQGLLMDAMVDDSIVLENLCGTLATDSLKDGRGLGFFDGEETPVAGESVDFSSHRYSIRWRGYVLMARGIPS